MNTDKCENACTENSDLGLKSRASFYYKLILLYFLNIIDWICTEVLIGSGKFYEGNPLMRSVLDNFALTVLIKGVLPLALVSACALFYRFANVRESKVTNFLLYGGIAVYTFIIIWHIINFVLLFWIF